MKIGLTVSFFDFRNDVRQVVKALLDSHEVVIFYRQGQRKAVLANKIDGAEYREIKENVSGQNNRLARLRYRLLRSIPRSENNFYLMEQFKLQSSGKASVLSLDNLVVQLHALFGGRMAYDDLLQGLTYRGETEIADVDHFLFFTEIADDEFLRRLLDSAIPVSVYVYSWDHPCKHTKFPAGVDYLVWNEGMAEDMATLQGIVTQDIEVLGASQFCYLAEYKQHVRFTLPRPYDFEYIYIGCAVGIKSLANQELAVIRQIALAAGEVIPNVKVVIRPYPLLDDWELYAELAALDNVVFDDDYRRADLGQSNLSIYEKVLKMDAALAFFHLGTTMGLECCFLDTPSFIVDLVPAEGKSAVQLYNFVHQYQNQKYLIDAAPANHIDTIEKLRTVLSHLDAAQYLSLNKHVQSENNIVRFPAYADKLVEALSSN